MMPHVFLQRSVENLMQNKNNDSKIWTLLFNWKADPDIYDIHKLLFNLFWLKCVNKMHVQLHQWGNGNVD